MKRKKILHITTHFHPFIGGLENMVFQLAKEQSKTYDVSILTCQYDKSLPLFEEIGGVKIYRFPSIKILKNQYSIPKSGFSKKVKELDVDVIFTHTRFFMTSFLGGFRKGNAQWIHVEHGQNFVRSKNPMIVLGAWLFDQTFGRYILKKADKVVVLGEEGKQFVEKFRKQGEISIIQNGIHIPEKIKKPPRKNRAIFFGRLIPEKGVREIIEAAKASPNWSFDIYGKGNQNYEITRLQDNKIRNNVVFQGQISPIEISKQIQNSDLVILPSWSEGNSLAILETAASARPIIATPVGQNEKIVSPEFIVPAKNAEKIIEKLNELENKWEALEKEGQSNLNKVQKLYSFKGMVEAYGKLINS